jgi:hypothetical protein
MESDDVESQLLAWPTCTPARPEVCRFGRMSHPRQSASVKRECFKKPYQKSRIYTVLIHDKMDDDSDMKKGTILTIENTDSVLVSVRRVTDKFSLCLWPRELCKINGYPPQRRLLTVWLEYSKSKNVLNSRSVRMRHITQGEKILMDFLKTPQENPQIKSLKDEIEAALVLLRYYKDHLDWQHEYPEGESYLMCCIGRAILILEN